MRYPLRISSSGNFAEGLVEVPGIFSGTDLTLPGQRPALLEAKGVIGHETDLELGPGAAWVAVELAKASRYRELIRKLIEQGLLALAPGAMPRLATKSMSGLFASLPLAEWHVAPLRVAGSSYAVSAADVGRHYEEAGTPLPPSTLAALAAWAKIERTDNDAIA